MRAILSGDLNAVSLFDLCQFFMLNRRSGELVIERGGKRAFVFFDQGQIVNAIDDGLNDGAPAAQRVLLMSEGTFEFREGSASPSRRIEISTENLLLEIARQVDELAATSGQRRATPGSLSADLSQAALFQLRQKQARDLEDLFRSVIGGQEAPEESGATGRFEDLLKAAHAAGTSVHYREESGGAVLLGAPGHAGTRIAIDAAAVRGFLKRALSPHARRRLARGGEVHGRFDSEGPAFHVRAWNRDGALGTDAMELTTAVPQVRPEALVEDLAREATSQASGALLLAVPPRGGATTLAAATLALLAEREPGRYLVVEERPRYRLEAAGTVCDRWAMDEVPGGPAGLVTLAARTGAALVAVDAVRDRRWLRAALETSRARFPVLATWAGAGTAAALRALVAGSDEEERRTLLSLLAETARIFFGAVPLEGGPAQGYARETVWCSLEARGLLGSGDLEGFESFSAEPGRADVTPLPRAGA